MKTSKQPNTEQSERRYLIATAVAGSIVVLLLFVAMAQLPGGGPGAIAVEEAISSVAIGSDASMSGALPAQPTAPEPPPSDVVSSAASGNQPVAPEPPSSDAVRNEASDNQPATF